uniref:PDZ domain-containing protein n=2 Tax=Parascaris univalens TaxID=6257 RepID=A0A915B552_PARUN
AIELRFVDGRVFYISFMMIPNSQANKESKEEDELQEKMLKERAHLFTRREGFSYHFVQIEWRRGSRFGLIIKAFEKFIVVSKLDPLSLCAQQLRIGDRLIDVDGKALTNREDAKREMVAAIKKNKKVSFIVERPESAEAKCWAKDALKSASTRTSSTAPREKRKWAKMSADQRARASTSATSEGTECTLRTTE